MVGQRPLPWAVAKTRLWPWIGLHTPTILSVLRITAAWLHETGMSEIEGPSTGEELAVAVDKIAETSPAVVQRLVTLFNNDEDARGGRGRGSRRQVAKRS